MRVRFVSGVVALLVSVSVAMAQDVAAPNAVGAKALLFTFSGLSTMRADAYNGGIGAKYFLMAPLALRAGLQFNSASQVDKTTLATGGKDGSISAMAVGVTLGAEYHFAFNRVSPYVGGVANFSTASTKEVVRVDVANGPAVTRENVAPQLGITPGNTFTIAGLGGVEFFITKDLSLSAEYQLGIGLPMGYKTKVTTVTGTTTTDVSADVTGVMRVGISNNGALTLAVYF